MKRRPFRLPEPRVQRRAITRRSEAPELARDEEKRAYDRRRVERLVADATGHITLKEDEPL